MENSLNSNHYDAIIIGAGMSGLACALRLGLYDKKVCLLEKHSISGGLNSYYQRKDNEGRMVKFDVGLHALTNFTSPKDRKAPLNKLVRQLKINYSDLNLIEQKQSLISMKDYKISFSNESKDFIDSIKLNFVKCADGIDALIEDIINYDELSLNDNKLMAREKIFSLVQNEELTEIILMPLLVYGSAWEEDMEWGQFVIMFKAIYLEGFSRPRGGVRTIINLLLDKIKECPNIELKFKSEVTQILFEENKSVGVTLKSGENLYAKKIFSSMGGPETFNRIIKKDLDHNSIPIPGNMTFSEIIFVLKDQLKKSFKHTIIFHNNSNKYNYQKPNKLFDSDSAVLCFPNNFSIDDLSESFIRITFMSNFDLWENLSKEDYKIQKDKMVKEALKIVNLYYELSMSDVALVDAFTPLTIKKYTGHVKGCVYGSTTKSKNGSTPFENLYLIGTDQGFLGIIGAMLSGISMANLYGLME